VTRRRDELDETDDLGDSDEDPVWELDLHGMPPERALRRLAQELHACRMRRRSTLLVITGRGIGNRTQQPILRTRVETWLKGAEGARSGVVAFELASKGGALLVRMRAPNEDAARARAAAKRRENRSGGDRV
jgi:DNA-nicking Smr family endonuclease